MEKGGVEAKRHLAAAGHHEPEKRQAARDCGLVLLSQATARAKLSALFRGAQIARNQLADPRGRAHGHHGH